MFMTRDGLIEMHVHTPPFMLHTFACHFGQELIFDLYVKSKMMRDGNMRPWIADLSFWEWFGAASSLQTEHDGRMD